VEHALSRKTFLKGGGALVVGFSMAASGLASKGKAATPWPAPSPEGYLPDLTQVDSWIRLNADNTVTVTSGQTDQGQGTQTALLMIVAEELDMGMHQMTFAPQDTWVNATGGGSASQGITTRALPVRAAAAAARGKLMDLAAAQLGVAKTALTVKDGVVAGGGRSVTYGALLGDRFFNVKMPAGATELRAGVAPAKPVSSYKLIGSSPMRIDIPDKVAGAYTYVHNVKLPGMWHARIIRPRGQGAVGSQNSRPVSIDESSIRHIPEAKVVRLNDFVAVVAPQEYDAIRAAAQLKVQWKSDPKLPSSGNFYADLRAKDSRGQIPAAYTTNTGNVDSALRSASKVLTQTYRYQYNAHVPIGPQCSVADVRMDQRRATIFCNSQSLVGVPTTVAPLIGLEPRQVRALYYEGSSTYGGGQIVDSYVSAAVISKAIGKPVKVQWMRWDQHGWDAFGPAAMVDIRAGIDANGKIVAFDSTTFGQPDSSVGTAQELLGTPLPATYNLSSIGRKIGDTVYSVPNRRELRKWQPLYNGAFKVNPLRSPGGPQAYFASEQMIDELAYAARIDPIAFRRANIDRSTVPGERWLSVLDAATKAANWQPRVAASNLSDAEVVTGRGCGFGSAGSFAAVVADIEVNKRTGKIVAKHLYIGQNNGITMYGEGVVNQAAGAAVQGLSRALYEQLRFTKERITNVDWVSYPILRFADAPKLTIVSVDARHLPEFGAGEGADVPVGSAVANAFFDATGVRIREAPMTPARVRAVLTAAGIRK
jgi:CO/xanthine dehydrogenase Mo-binding subunit